MDIKIRRRLSMPGMPATLDEVFEMVLDDDVRVRWVCADFSG